MKKYRIGILDGALIAGFGMIVAGVYQIHPPTACIVAGLLLCGCVFTLAR